MGTVAFSQNQTSLAVPRPSPVCHAFKIAGGDRMLKVLILTSLLIICMVAWRSNISVKIAQNLILTLCLGSRKHSRVGPPENISWGILLQEQNFMRETCTLVLQTKTTLHFMASIGHTVLSATNN